MNANEYLYDLEAIKGLLPHRYPFLFVDRIMSIDKEEKKIIGIKNLSQNEEFFQGHFPEKAVMPQTFVLEAMAQCGGILILSQMENPEKMNVFFTSITDCEFFDEARPGDQIRFEMIMIRFKLTICQMNGFAYINDKLICSAKIAATIRPNE
jgi:UDP-3-O-[3-hydroxymyristoyl] N-acetylglucosamine deacetylase/3-hydroxyacyl-[acyl-carrier-protein] dehydratase